MPGVTAVVLYSDGVPSQGARGNVELVNAVQRENRHSARIFVVSPGPVNSPAGEQTLAAIAQSARGDLRVLESASTQPTGEPPVPTFGQPGGPSPRSPLFGGVTAGQQGPDLDRP